MTLGSFPQHVGQPLRFFKKAFLKRGICCIPEWSPKHGDGNKPDLLLTFVLARSSIDPLQPLTVLWDPSNVAGTMETVQGEVVHLRKEWVCSFLTLPI